MTNTNLPIRTCHVCGLPSWAISGSGFITKITVRAENRFARDRHLSVWCCSRSCAVQANAISTMGAATHKWPITLAEFAASKSETLDIREAGADRTETVAETRVNTGVGEAESQVLDSEHTEGVSVRRIAPRNGGRPRKRESEAQRLRTYRQRKAEMLHSPVVSPNAEPDTIAA